MPTSELLPVPVNHIYDNIGDPMRAMEMLGSAIAESGIFGCTNKQQGMVLAWECLATRTPALSLAKANHIIGNKLSMKADAMLSEFSDRGGKHKIIERTPDSCVIEFTSKDGINYKMSINWEDSQGEPFPYETRGGKKESEIVDEILAWKAGKGPQPKLKPKYATPRSRMQMLFARLVSDSVRAIDPGVNFGRYAPEEIDDEVSNEAADRRPRKSAKQVMQEAATAGHDAIDVPFEVKSEPEVEVSPATSTTSNTSEPQYATHAQCEEIRGLFQQLGIDGDAQQEILRKKSVTSLRSLTEAQAGEMLTKLRAAAAKTAEPEQPKADGPTSMSLNDPCLVDQVATIKSLAAEIEQLQPGTVAKIGEKLKACGLAKFSDLTFAEARDLEHALRVKNISAFFEASLKGFKPGN